jgi:hypothetical protein
MSIELAVQHSLLRLGTRLAHQRREMLNVSMNLFKPGPHPLGRSGLGTGQELTELLGLVQVRGIKLKLKTLLSETIAAALQCTSEKPVFSPMVAPTRLSGRP